MTIASASGERSALRGYQWQYDHIAALVYDAIYDDEFVELRLTDPEAGRIDDLVLARNGRIDAFQFKSVADGRSVTFRQLERPEVTRSGATAPSLLGTLGDGWHRLKTTYLNPNVHLVMEHRASTIAILRESGAVEGSRSRHLGAFIDTVLVPIRLGDFDRSAVNELWLPALERPRNAAGLEVEEYDDFLRALYLEFGVSPALATDLEGRRVDIIELSDALRRRVADSNRVVVLNRASLMTLMNWEERQNLRSRHEFPVDLEIYAPLTGAISDLSRSVDANASGYIAIVGPPGSGKSTLLSQVLGGNTDRVIHYYAYVPGLTASLTRLKALSFLHDVITMFRRSGIDTAGRQLQRQNLDQLRQQFAECLTAASAEFLETGRRTILIVDGLDHVEREIQGPDAMIIELPASNEVPQGVVIIVGSRTVSFLKAAIRVQIEEPDRQVDLSNYRISRAAILDVCQRSSITADLSHEIHLKLAQLSDGYPLSLNYLFNRLRSNEGGSPEEALANAPAYEGDIAAEYMSAWADLEDDYDVEEILAVCSRLRIGFETTWLETWAPLAAVHKFRRKLMYLFRRHDDGLRFFHDSFRQFASDRTAYGDELSWNEAVNLAKYRHAADLVAGSDDDILRSEELFLRHLAADEERVLELAQIPIFRAQFKGLRSPLLIRSDIETAMEVAARSGDVRTLLRLILSMVEVTERTSTLEYIDVADLFFSAGLTREAINYCSVESRQVPLAYAYNLAARLGDVNNSKGHQLFDSIAHDLFDDPDRTPVSGHEDDAASSWASAAIHYRTFPQIVEVVRSIFPLSDAVPSDRYSTGRSINRYEVVMKSLMDALFRAGKSDELLLVDQELEKDLHRMISDESGLGDVKLRAIATCIDLRVRLKSLLLKIVTERSMAREMVVEILDLVRSGPVFSTTLLECAEIGVEFQFLDDAKALLARTNHSLQLDVQSLSYGGVPNVIDLHFRYWRLVFKLEFQTSPSEVQARLVQEASVTSELDEPTAYDPERDDPEAFRLAVTIEDAVKALAKLSVEPDVVGQSESTAAWDCLLQTLEVFRVTSIQSKSSTYRGMLHRELDLLSLAIRVTQRIGSDVSQRFYELISDRIGSEPERWPLARRLEIGASFESLGIAASWYERSIAEEEAEIVLRSVYSRLEDTAKLVRIHIKRGSHDEAHRLLRTLIPLSFGVGYRKDYQFDAWVSVLTSATASGDQSLLADTVWLAQVLNAASPMTEGAPGQAALQLPPAVVPMSPLGGVRVFEFLVRNGVVGHFQALSDLLTSLLRNVSNPDSQLLHLSSDLIAYLLAPAANIAFPKVANALVDAAVGAGGAPLQQDLAKSIAERTDRFALESCRNEWREGLGLAPLESDHEADRARESTNDYGQLILSDGQRFAEDVVQAKIETAEDICNLRRCESNESMFSWPRVFENLHFNPTDIAVLAEVFDDGSRIGGEVLAILAESALEVGESGLAIRLVEASEVLTSPYSWTGFLGTSRRRTARVKMRINLDESRKIACQDLVHELMENRWFARALVDDLLEIIEVLDSSVVALDVWAEVKSYLVGMAETMNLAEDDVLDDRRTLWWITGFEESERMQPQFDTCGAAVAELVVAHLTHPAWLVKTASTNVVVRALIRGDSDIADALERLARPGAPDSVLESVGACIRALRNHPNAPVPDCIDRVEQLLSSSENQVLRNLAPHTEELQSRPLPPVYRLSLPPPDEQPIGLEPMFLLPHEGQYELLAGHLDLEIDTLITIADGIARRCEGSMPSDAEVREALRSAEALHAFPSQRILASRSAFGQVLAALTDAHLISELPTWLRRRLRTLDPHLIVDIPGARPETIPPPPQAGHDLNWDKWRREVDYRLEELLSCLESSDATVLAGRCQLEVLNWGRLQEEVEWGTIVGRLSEPPTEIFLRRASLLIDDLSSEQRITEVSNGHSLILENIGWTFNQPNADWIAFRPDIARRLGWIPDSNDSRRWFNRQGEIAVETLSWVDGWCGRVGPVFHDTSGQGILVVLSNVGKRELIETHSSLTSPDLAIGIVK
jgi:hypothetical protein